jgi:hypothetical protein
MKSRKIRLPWHVASMSAKRVFVGKPAENRQLRRTRPKWEDNIKCILEKYDTG